MPLRTVTIVEHRAAWSVEFEAVAMELREALGVDALQLDHIGSTAVPALAAKDIIDVQVTVRSLDESLAQRLLAAGFTTHTQVARQDHVPPGFAAREQDWSKRPAAPPRGADLIAYGGLISFVVSPVS
jgi:GrpB-like predicted nucleotidyltransferase (UPF0157 family)